MTGDHRQDSSVPFIHSNNPQWPWQLWRRSHSPAAAPLTCFNSPPCQPEQLGRTEKQGHRQAPSWAGLPGVFLLLRTHCFLFSPAREMPLEGMLECNQLTRYSPAPSSLVYFGTRVRIPNILDNKQVVRHADKFGSGCLGTTTVQSRGDLPEQPMPTPLKEIIKVRKNHSLYFNNEICYTLKND